MDILRHPERSNTPVSGDGVATFTFNERELSQLWAMLTEGYNGVEVTDDGERVYRMIGVAVRELWKD